MIDFSRRDILRAGAVTACAGACAGARAAETVEDALHFDDLLRFEALMGGQPSAEAIEAYLAAATPGLSAYLDTYRVAAAAYAERIAERPGFYRSLIGLRDRLRPFEPAVRAAMARVRALVPGTPAVPVYLFVGTLGPGATVKEVRPGVDAASLGILMPAEHVAIDATTDLSEFPEGRAGRAEAADLPGFIAHEYAHVAQVGLQGLARYRTLYSVPARATNLAFAVREGGAELVSALASGRLRARHRYFIENRAELIREFVAIADRPVSETRGWFSGIDQTRPERPAQMGYALGWDLCRRYLDSASDRSAALITLLSAVEPEDFRAIAAPYFQ